MIWGLHQGEKLSLHIFNSSPRDTADFPKKWVQAAHWASRSPPETVSSDMTCLFCFMGAVLMQGIGWLNLSGTAMLDEPLLSSLFSSTCTTLYLWFWGTWWGGAVTGEMSLLCWAGTCHHCPRSLEFSRERIRNPPYRAFCLPIGPVSGKVRCISLSHSLIMLNTRGFFYKCGRSLATTALALCRSCQLLSHEPQASGGSLSFHRGLPGSGTH